MPSAVIDSTEVSCTLRAGLQVLTHFLFWCACRLSIVTSLQQTYMPCLLTKDIFARFYCLTSPAFICVSTRQCTATHATQLLAGNQIKISMHLLYRLYNGATLKIPKLPHTHHERSCWIIRSSTRFNMNWNIYIFLLDQGQPRWVCFWPSAVALQRSNTRVNELCGVASLQCTGAR